MTVLADYTASRTIDGLVDRIAALKPTGPVEAWLFDDRKTRQAAERRLAASGITARFYSAYKPLTHFIIEDADLSGVSKVVVRYPVVHGATEKRFRLETYPLSALIGDAEHEFVPNPGNSTTYPIEMTGHT